MAALFSNLTQNSFLRPVAMLVTGASFAQLINIILLPVLTQIFTPADFDVLAVFAAISIITYRGASLGLDYALPIADSDEKAAKLLIAALVGVVAVASVVGIATAMAIPMVPDHGKGAAYDIFVWLVPLSTLLIGTTTAFEFWTTRKKRFALVSRARILQVLLGGGLQVTLGLAGAGADGLLIGYLVINCAALVLLAGTFLAHDRHLLRQVSAPAVVAAVREYSTFPKFTAAEVVANSCSVYLPIVIISGALVGPEAGFLLLALRLTQGPMVMITQAVSQVYHSRARESRLDKRLGEDTAAVLRALVGVTAAPVAALAVVAPELIAAILGELWRPVGVYMSWTLPSTFLLLLSASIITTMHTHGRNAQILILTLFGVALRTGTVGLAAVYAPAWLIPAYAIGGAVFYGVSLAVFMRVSAVKFLQIVPRNRLTLGASAVLIIAALLLKFAFVYL